VTAEQQPQRKKGAADAFVSSPGAGQNKASRAVGGQRSRPSFRASSSLAGTNTRPDSGRTGGSSQGGGSRTSARARSEGQGAVAGRSQVGARSPRAPRAGSASRASTRGGNQGPPFAARGERGGTSSRAPSERGKAGSPRSTSRQAWPHGPKDRQSRPATDRAERGARSGQFGGARPSPRGNVRAGAPYRGTAQSPDRREARRGRPAPSGRLDEAFDRRQPREPGPRWGRPGRPAGREGQSRQARPVPFAGSHERPEAYRSRDERPYPAGGGDRRPETGTRGEAALPSRGSSRGRRDQFEGTPKGPEGRRRSERRTTGFGPDRDRGYGRAGGGGYARGGRKDGAPGPSARAQDRQMPTSWGSVTRRGARALSYDGPSASDIWSAARASAPFRAGRNMMRVPDRGSTPEARDDARPAAQRPEPEDWEIVLVEKLPPPARRNVTKPASRPPRAAGARSADRTARPPSLGVASAKSAGRGKPAQKNDAKLEDAARAYSADRYQDALRILRKLSAQSPGSAAVRELLGLTLYRMGRWLPAVRELQVHHELSGSYDQFPVIADSYRAMRNYADAEATWEQLRQASPSAEVVAEGRLVAAGSLADQGDLRGAVKLLEGSLRRSRPRAQHLRQWYALADLYERAGELPRARDLFSQVAAIDPDAYDVRQRLVALG
jgi:tetratricopeptide (TPR) repeat protein